MAVPCRRHSNISALLLTGFDNHFECRAFFGRNLHRFQFVLGSRFLMPVGLGLNRFGLKGFRDFGSRGPMRYFTDAVAKGWSMAVVCDSVDGAVSKVAVLGFLRGGGVMSVVILEGFLKPYKREPPSCIAVVVYAEQS